MDGRVGTGGVDKRGAAERGEAGEEEEQRSLMADRKSPGS